MKHKARKPKFSRVSLLQKDRQSDTEGEKEREKRETKERQKREKR